MNRATRRLKKRKGRFVGIPYDVASNHLFAELTAPETKLLIDILIQFNGRNNGMLSACYTLMKSRGWARSSLYRAFCGLQHKGFVVVTRQGWKRRGKPTLVGITWVEINPPLNGVEYDEGIQSSAIPLSYWCKAKSGWKNQPKAKEPKKNMSSNMEDKNASYYSKLTLVDTGN